MGPLTTFSIFLLCIIESLSGASTTDVASPCPELFKYGSLNTPGKYEATLIANVHFDLHGLWLTLVFDKPVVKKITADGYESSKTSNDTEYLVMNKTLFVKAGSSKTLKLTIKYKGKDVPHLVAYRINAVTVCPDTESKYFLGDKRSEEYLKSITKPLGRPRFRFPVPIPIRCGAVSSNSSKISPPWENALFLKINGTNEYVCDATLISNSIFITAAHCITYLNSTKPIPTENIKIFFGNSTPHAVSNIAIYPGYNPINFFNDIALFQLEKAVQTTDTIMPLCFLSSSSKDGIIGGFVNVSRLAVKAKEITRNQCLRKLPKLKSLLDNTICVEYSEAPPNGCIGQSGSSFVVSSSGSKVYNTLRGIVVAGATLQGNNECNKGTTVVLADVSRYETWIIEHKTYVWS